MFRHLANLLLRATAWRNILIAARPSERFRWRTVTGAYLAGVGVNAIVPARGGDVVKIYLVHRSVPKTPYATIVKGPATDAGWCEAYRGATSVLLVKDCSLLDKR